jgi:hypothetical protein
MTFPAHAVYHRDGTLFEVRAYVNDHLFSIHVAEERILRTSLIMIDEPIVMSMIHGVEVAAHYTGNHHEASFMLGSAAYLIQVFDGGGYQIQLMTEIVNRLILGGPADLSVLADPEIPELRDEWFTLEEAYGDPEFGRYLPIPLNLPPRFQFESAHRFMNQQQNGLMVHWNNSHLRGLDYLHWNIQEVSDWHLERLVAPEETAKYDMSLYPIPWMDSMPEDIREFAVNPVFRMEELTLEVIRMRTQWVDGGRGDTPGYRMQFSVLLGDIVIELHANGLTPEEVWSLFSVR